MDYNINDRLEFGKYNGLTVKEIYQGTLNINQELLHGYLEKILDKGDPLKWGIDLRFVDIYKVSMTSIKIIGEIHDHEKPESPGNIVVLGNREEELSSFINYHFEENFLGILEDIASFNKSQDKILNIGGDPEYLEWCSREVEGFKLAVECKKELEKLSVARLVGIHILYIGDESYSYAPNFEVRSFKF